MRLAVPFLSLCVTLAPFCVTLARAAAPARHVVIISVDGLRPDAMLRAKAPTMQALARQGSATLKAQTILPSSTLPSHTSMLTGVGVARHQITWNSWQPEKGLVKVPTVFEVARAAGMSTAMFVGKDKFKHLERPGTLDAFEIPAYDASKVAAAAAAHLITNQPRLLFVHLADVDGAGHEFMWMSSVQMHAVTRADDAIARVMQAVEAAGMRETTAIIITADHGGHLFTHGSDRPEDMTIPWIAVGAGVRPGFPITAKVTTYDTAATALALLGVAPPADWDGKPVASALAGGAPAGRAGLPELMLPPGFTLE